MNRILNLSLRALTLVAKFMFLFFLAKFLDPASVGLYGLFAATVGYSLYFVGFDFYTYTTREILKAKLENRGLLLKSHIALSLSMYCVFIPLAYVAFHYKILPAQLFVYFVPILILEHFNQEASRLLIALSQQLTSTIILFIRQGSWSIAVVAIMMNDVHSRVIELTLIAWTISGAAAAVFAVWRLKMLHMGGWAHKVDWYWIRAGLKTSIFFLVGTLALRGIQTIDRYWLESLGGLDMVGAYVLFLGMAGTLLVFLDAGVFAFSYPKLIQLRQQSQFHTFHLELKKMFLHTLAISFGFGVISLLALPILLDWIGNPFYKLHSGLFAWLLIGMIINAISMVPHYALYANGRDRSILVSHIGGLAVFLVSTWVAAKFDPGLAVPIGLASSFLFILLWKSVAYSLDCATDEPAR